MLEIGFVARAHGLRGDVIVELTTNRDERVLAGTVLRRRSGGDLRILESSPMGGARRRWIVTFEGVVDRAGADGLRGEQLLAAPIDDADELWVHDLIGTEVRDGDGVTHGTVTSVEANPASDLLVTDTGALVPLRFVVERGAGWVRVDPPDGLFDL